MIEDLQSTKLGMLLLLAIVTIVQYTVNKHHSSLRN